MDSLGVSTAVVVVGDLRLGCCPEDQLTPAASNTKDGLSCERPRRDQVTHPHGFRGTGKVQQHGVSRRAELTRPLTRA